MNDTNEAKTSNQKTTSDTRRLALRTDRVRAMRVTRAVVGSGVVRTNWMGV